MSDVMAVLQVLYRLHRGVCIPDYEKVLEQSYFCFLSNMDRRNMVIVDVGAHSGRHLERFAEIVGNHGRAIAFEPLPHLAKALRTRFPDVDVREFALGRVPSEGTFHYFHTHAEMSGLLQRPDVAGTAERLRVKIDTLDNQVSDLDRLDYLKIDIEGAEIDCLVGGRNVITRLRPFISVEYGKPTYSAYGHTALSLFALASELNYTLADVFGNLIEGEAEWLSICDRVYWDYFMIPNERVDEWRAYFQTMAMPRG